MKKFCTFVILTALFFACFGILAVHAVTEELLENGNFETGDIMPYARYGHASSYDVDQEYAHSGDYGVAVTDREGKYACYQQNVKAKIKECGPGKYRASVWVRLLEEDSGEANCQLVINYKELGQDADKYLTSQKLTLTDQWQEFIIEKQLDYDQQAGLDHVYVYVQVLGTGTEEAPSYCMDDFSLVKVSEVNGIKNNYDNLSPIDVSGVARSEQTTVGVIRWDAWYTHDGNPSSVVSQVEKALSPAEYHFRAPFFAKVTDDGRIEIPAYTQEIFDQEMQYAIDAGIDYFAFLMYDNAMKTAREFYKASKLNNQIRMCCIVSPGQGVFYKEVVSLFRQNYYMTVLDGRPLIFIYIGNESQWDFVKDDIGYYRTACEKEGIQAPFFAIMSSTPAKVANVFGDAAARYGVGVSGGVPFSQLVSEAKTMWEENKANCRQVIPNVSFGWHTIPRYKNPVSWMQVNENSYAQYATDEELYHFMKDALEYMQKDENKAATKANTITVYAWNEHDEGGWICPTIEVDENGKQVLDANGKAKINTGHLDAMKRAITEIKSGKPTEEEVSSVPTASESAKPGLTWNEKSTPGFLIPVICGGVVLTVGAVVLLVLLKKRRHREDDHTDET